MSQPLTTKQVVENLRTIKSHKEFRGFVDDNLMSLYENEDCQIPWKLKADVAGLLYIAIHGTTEGKEE